MFGGTTSYEAQLSLNVLLCCVTVISIPELHKTLLHLPLLSGETYADMVFALKALRLVTAECKCMPCSLKPYLRSYEKPTMVKVCFIVF